MPYGGEQGRPNIWSLFQRYRSRSDTERRDQWRRHPTFGGYQDSRSLHDIWESFWKEFQDVCDHWTPPGRESRNDWLATHGAKKTVYEETFNLVKRCKIMALRKEGYKASERLRGGGQEVLVFCYFSFVSTALALLNDVSDTYVICFGFGLRGCLRTHTYTIKHLDGWLHIISIETTVVHVHDNYQRTRRTNGVPSGNISHNAITTKTCGKLL